ncbi:hypothetical protein RhiirA1_439089 [Rhizophagus irregularis]|uniref:Uncharacterized protein n=1 Tax=Rhizophagus irregularis TaxID=588596 RepID=A0A2I1EXI2_9GLOM|nr:hypothetical protein RhiirA1_439089 [Rhizophagus irregularis]PKY26818.1 hypothetical protein RhiirB3_473220 [Rhizophagus irregularis]
MQASKPPKALIKQIVVLITRNYKLIQLIKQDVNYNRLFIVLAVDCWPVFYKEKTKKNSKPPKASKDQTSSCFSTLRCNGLLPNAQLFPAYLWPKGGAELVDSVLINTSSESTSSAPPFGQLFRPDNFAFGQREPPPKETHQKNHQKHHRPPPPPKEPPKPAPASTPLPKEPPKAPAPPPPPPPKGPPQKKTSKTPAPPPPPPPKEGSPKGHPPKETTPLLIQKGIWSIK